MPFSYRALRSFAFTSPTKTASASQNAWHGGPLSAHSQAKLSLQRQKNSASAKVEILIFETRIILPSLWRAAPNRVIGLNPHVFFKIRNSQSLMLYCPAWLHYPRSACSRSTRRRGMKRMAALISLGEFRLSRYHSPESQLRS